MGTVHTFLLFVADGGRLDDVYIDVTFKQFLVLPDWMETRHYEAAERLGLFRQFPDAFVGTAEELAALMTLSALRTALEAAYAAAPDAAPSRISSFVNETALSTAPVSSRTLLTSWCPRLAARINGVAPGRRDVIRCHQRLSDVIIGNQM
jgi:hypothetical protein